MSSPRQQEECFVEENRQAEEAITANDFKKAVGILVGIIDHDPENFRAYNNIGIISWSQKNWQDAYLMFLKSVTLKPDYTDALVNLFDAALKLKKINEIRPLFENAYLLNPDSEEIKIFHDSILEQGENIYTSRRALSIGIYNPLIEEAKKELDSGHLFRAMELFLQVNDSDGPNAEAFCGLGIISFYQQHFNDAYVLFIESIKLNPTDMETFMNLLDAANACNRFDEAQTIFTTYLQDFPELEPLKEYFDKK